MKRTMFIVAGMLLVQLPGISGRAQTETITVFIKAHELTSRTPPYRIAFSPKVSVTMGKSAMVTVTRPDAAGAPSTPTAAR